VAGDRDRERLGLEPPAVAGRAGHRDHVLVELDFLNGCSAACVEKGDAAASPFGRFLPQRFSFKIAQVIDQGIDVLLGEMSVGRH
jgi:hypothetical protein